MNEIVLFSIGSVLFILVTWATLVFFYLRFSDLYRVDQAATDPSPDNAGQGTA